MDYSYIIIPIIVAIATQALKLITDSIRGNFTLSQMLLSYGGMPSSHAAFSASITTLIGLRLGVDAPMFALALVLTLLIMRDAVSFRALLGNQAKLLNRVRARLPESEQKEIPKFRERMGHSLLEVLLGATTGLVLTYLLNLFSVGV